MVTTLQLKESVESYFYEAFDEIAECCRCLLRDADPNITEKLMYHIWEQRHFFAQNLTTIDRKPVEILNWGQRNTAAGPDFTEATLKIDGRTRHGDIEMHLETSDWFRHQHHTDPRYNNVILHVVLWDMAPDLRPQKANGRYIPTLLIRHFLDDSLQKVQQKLSYLADAMWYPCQKIKEERRADAFAPVLKQFGSQRLMQKAARFQTLYEQTQSWDDVFYQGIAEALGYEKNKRAFQHLTRILPFEHIRHQLQSIHYKSLPDMTLWLQAILFGAADLVPDEEPQPEDATQTHAFRYRAALVAHWKRWQQKFPLHPMSREEWVFTQQRPSNFPTRRLAALSYLLTNVLPEGWLHHFLAPFEEFDVPREILANLETQLNPAGNDYWQYHLTLADNPQKKAMALIGSSRRQVILGNIVLPILLAYADHTSNAALAEKINAVWDALPTPDPNRVTRSFDKLWHLDAKSRRQFRSVRIHQGLIQLYQDVCEKKLCEKCPLGTRERITAIE